MLALGLKEGAVVVSDLKQSEGERWSWLYGNSTFLVACVILQGCLEWGMRDTEAAEVY